ncbi:pyridoxal phosphate homeostasis protein-like isoform X2 [Hyalella azteca]|uniref:Pyridoxal phosphate homeostasis protein n=1 Tax=Hyalella azteca TaxID=294128 RepID=A0A8B7NNU1_HYAAZ|nr:pyridoxal phosphate homeostasis protein-like isoform X1 [Hyalella azteca]XP_018015335.1 pyridoxal phosphate homeostasis protein-like isoform X2 [Hyalella azteca]
MFRVMAGDGGEVTKALRAVVLKIKAATAARSPEVSEWCAVPRLVAVSKTKPKEMVIEAYLAGQRHFGENYVQELVAKAADPEILTRCPDIRWHMIGPMQSNKAKKVLSIPNLFLIETVHSAKLASLLDAIWAKAGHQHRLNIYVQVNTSEEAQKSGVAPGEVTQLTEHVINNCPNLNLLGLMTIGAYDYDLSLGPNPDFQRLLQCRDAVCAHHSLHHHQLELSMGMSADYEHAISVGSSNVRVGSVIFGSRSHEPQ